MGCEKSDCARGWSSSISSAKLREKKLREKERDLEDEKWRGRRLGEEVICILDVERVMKFGIRGESDGAELV